MELLEEDFDTDFERMVYNYSQRGYSSTHKMNYETVNYLIECYHKHRECFGLDKAQGCRDYILKEIDLWLLEGFNDAFGVGEYSDKGDFDYKEEKAVDDKDRSKDLNETIRIMEGNKL